MTEYSTEQRGDTRARTAPPSPSTPTAGPATSGWVSFGGIVMVVLGVFGVIEGLFALFTPTTYVVSASGAVVAVGLGSWAWIHLIVGALVALTGAGILSGNQPWARIVGMVIVGISVLVHLVWLPVAPIWSIIVIALEIAVLAALAAAGEPDEQRI